MLQVGTISLSTFLLPSILTWNNYTILVERLFSLSLAGVAKSAELERDLDVEMKRLG